VVSLKDRVYRKFRFENIVDILRRKLLLRQVSDHRKKSDMIDNPVLKADHFFVAFDNSRDSDAVQCAAIIFADDNFLGHIDEPAGQITCVRGLKCGSARPLRAPWVEMKYSKTFKLP